MTRTERTSRQYLSLASDAGRFFALAFGISWALWAPLLAFGQFPGGQLLGVAGAFGPFVAAGVLIRRRHGSLEPLWRPLVRWRVGVRWYLVVLVGPVLAIVAATAVANAVGAGVGQQPLGWAAFPAVLAFSIVLGGGQEEPGWRGYAQPALQSRFSALSSSLIIGVLWAVWHLPAFAIPGATQSATGLNFGILLLYAPGMAVLLAWIYNATGGSVLLCVLAHGAANAATVAVYPIAGVTSQLILAAAVWVLALTVIVMCGARTLGGDRAAVRRSQ